MTISIVFFFSAVAAMIYLMIVKIRSLRAKLFPEENETESEKIEPHQIKYFLTKKDKKELTKIANQLPVTYQDTFATSHKSGHDLFAQGHRTGPDGKPLKLNAFYETRKPAVFPVNHKRKIFRAFEIGGIEGVKGYVSGVYELVKSHEKITGQTA